MNRNDYINELNSMKSSEEYKQRLYNIYLNDKKKNGSNKLKVNRIGSFVYVLCFIILISTIGVTGLVLKNGKTSSHNNEKIEETTTDNQEQLKVIESSELPVECVITRSDNKYILNITVSNNSNRTVDINREFCIYKRVDGINLLLDINYDEVTYESENDDEMISIEAGDKYVISMILNDACPGEHWYNEYMYYDYEVEVKYVGSTYLSSWSIANSKFNVNTAADNHSISDKDSVLTTQESNTQENANGEYILNGKYTNKQLYDVSTGEDYQLYYSPYSEVEGFTPISMKDGAGFIEIMNYINSTQEYSLEINIGDAYDISKFENGYYVIVKEFSCGDDGTRYMIMGKFNIN